MGDLTRLVLRRARAQAVVVGAAFLTILLAATVLSAVATYLGEVSDAGVRAALQASPGDSITTEVRSALTASELPRADREAREAVTAAVGDLPHSVAASAISGSFALPTPPTGDQPVDLTLLATYADLAERASLVAGSWPAETRSRPDGAVEAVVHHAAAERLGLEPGDTLRLVERTGGDVAGLAVQVRVTGSYALIDPADPFWPGAGPERDGVQRLSFTTYGPFAVPAAAFADVFADRRVTARWRVVPRIADLDASDLPALRRASASIEQELEARGRAGDTVMASDTETLDALARTLLVARSTMLVPVVQLALLAAVALMLTARLLDEHRRGETALLRARGTARRQLIGLALAEGVLLAGPAAVLGPILAGVLLELLGRADALRDAGVALDGRPGTTTYVVGAVAAVACTAALIAPALARSRSYVETQSNRGRPDRRTAIQRVGIDLALVLVAALALWQLAFYGSPVTTDAQGRLGADPLLVLAPALALLAGAVLVIRLLPWLGSVAERVASRRAGLGAALAAWQVNRRPARYAGPALLVVLAVGIGALSAAHSRTWETSRLDQADFRAGADLRLDARVLELGGLHEPAGVDVLAPVARTSTTLGGDSAATAVIALDAHAVPDLLRLRGDLASEPLAEITSRLATARPAPEGVVLAGAPRTLTITAHATAPAGVLDLAATVADASGARYRTPVGALPTDSTSRSFSVDLARLAGGLAPRPPLRLVGFHLLYSGADTVAGPGDPSASPPPPVRLTVEQVRSDDRPVEPPRGWMLRRTETAEFQLGPQPTPTDQPGFLGLAFPDVSGTAIVARPQPVTASTDSLAVPAVLSTAALRNAGTSVGDRLMVRVAGVDLAVKIVGTVEAVPSTDPAAGAMLLDLPTLGAVVFDRLAVPLAVDEWWAAVTPDRWAEARASLAVPAGAVLADRSALRETLLDDPLGVGVKGALLAGFVAAAAFAVIGFAVNAVVAGRERLTEFAVVRALGMAERQVFGVVAGEQALLVTIALAAGAALGLLVAAAVLPLVTVAADAGGGVGAGGLSAVPVPLVVVPWLSVAALLIAVALALAATIVAVARRLRRLGIGATLRLGEDR